MSLPAEIIAEEEWWHQGSLSDDYAEQLKAFASRTKSWSEDLELYGKEDGNCLKILRDNGQIVSVSVRIDLRQIDRQFIEGTVLFAHCQKCHLVTTTGEMFAPETNLLKAKLKESRAFRFVFDPEKYLQELKTNPIQFPE